MSTHHSWRMILLIPVLPLLWLNAAIARRNLALPVAVACAIGGYLCGRAAS